MTPGRWLLVAAIGFVGLTMSALLVFTLLPVRGPRARVESASTTTAPVLLSWEGKAFRRGDRVRITHWAGTIKPEESGLANELDCDEGRTGVVLDAPVRSSRDGGTPGEPLQLLRVRWDAQRWKVNGEQRWIERPAFESTIHADYLQVIAGE